MEDRVKAKIRPKSRYGSKSQQWHKEWGSYGCALLYLKALFTVQLVFIPPLLACQILLFFLGSQRWEYIVYPSSVSSILYLIGTSVGIAGLAKRQKSLLAGHMVIASAAILAQVVLTILSQEPIKDHFWAVLTTELGLTSIHAWLLLLFSALETLLTAFSILTAAVALSRYNPAFKDRTLGYRTSTVRRKVLEPQDKSEKYQYFQ